MRAGPEHVRSEEWRLIRRFSTAVRANADDLAALAICGEPGAGKSTLWRAGVEAAADGGVRVLRSEPAVAEVTLPFAGLIDLLGSATSAVADLPEPQRDALEVALLIRPAGAQPPTAHAVGLGVLAVLRTLAATGPVLIAVDDAHWLDEASVSALSFALRRTTAAPISCLLAVRTEAVADTLGMVVPAPPQHWRELVADVPHRTVELASLDLKQIRGVLPTTVSAAHLRLAAEQSRGNPFWAKEIAASLAAEQSPIPALARNLTDRLARSLTADAAEALAVVGAAGRISVARAQSVLAELADPAGAVDEAVLAGVVTETEGRLAAAHPLIGAAAVAALPPARRGRLYRRLAASATEPETFAHFSAMAASADPDETVASALDAAADSAHRRAGNAEAAQFAVRALELTEPGRADRRQKRQVRAAELLYLAGDVRASLTQARSLDLDQVPTPLLERLLPLLLDLTDMVEGTPTAIRLMTSVREQGLQSPDRRRRALILALASDASYGIPGDRRTTAGQAIDDAEAVGSAADWSLHKALQNLVVAKVTAGDGMDYALLDRAEELQDRLQSDLLHDSTDLQRGLWCRRVEDLDGSRTALEHSIDLARKTGDDFVLVTLLIHLTVTEELAGRYARAREVLATADAVAGWHDWPPRAWHAEARCDLLIADGDLDSALALADQAMPDATGQAATVRFLGNLVRGRVSAWRGDHAAAVSWFEPGGRYADEREFADPGVRRGIDTELAESYVALGRSDEAGEIAARLREVGTRLNRPTLLGNADRIDAEGAAVAGDLDRAGRLAARAVSAHESVAVRLELARSLLVRGRIERRRRTRRDARRTLLRARDLTAEIGHQPLLAQIETELSRVSGSRSSGVLTATEQQVAELLVEGASSREVAASLFVSVRTVESHVAAIYRKLGVRNRADLVRRLGGASSPSGSSGS